jgi:hypothetical protein
VKQSPTAHLVDARCSSRKCFTAIQTARHSAMVSHAVPNIQVIRVIEKPVLLKLTLHRWVPDRMYSTNICLISLKRKSLKYIMEAYSLKDPYFVPRALPHRWFGQSGIFRREIRASSWMADTWHVSERSQWLACYLSQANIVKPCNWVAHHQALHLWQ